MTLSLDARLGGLLRDERLRQGLTQRDIAVRMGVAVSFIQAIEYGQTSRRTDSYERYANALGKSLAAAFNDRGDPADGSVHGGGSSLD